MPFVWVMCSPSSTSFTLEMSTKCLTIVHHAPIAADGVLPYGDAKVQSTEFVRNAHYRFHFISSGAIMTSVG